MTERPTETERIALSQRERDRLKVLHDVQQKQLTQVCDGVRCQMPAYHAYPSSAPNTPEPKPLPNCLRLSVIVRRVMYLTFL
jgi:hypothetical protein